MITALLFAFDYAKTYGALWCSVACRVCSRLSHNVYTLSIHAWCVFVYVCVHEPRTNQYVHNDSEHINSRVWRMRKATAVCHNTHERTERERKQHPPTDSFPTRRRAARVIFPSALFDTQTIVSYRRMWLSVCWMKYIYCWPRRGTTIIRQSFIGCKPNIRDVGDIGRLVSSRCRTICTPYVRLLYFPLSLSGEWAITSSLVRKRVSPAFATSSFTHTATATKQRVTFKLRLFCWGFAAGKVWVHIGFIHKARCGRTQHHLVYGPEPDVGSNINPLRCGKCRFLFNRIGIFCLKCSEYMFDSRNAT